MTDTTFIHGTTVEADWLNNVNDRVYNDIINVKNAPYNAVGDGVTDDTAAIQAAFDYAVTLQTLGLGNGSGGSIVFFPRGIYKHTALTLVPTSGLISVQLIGAGRGTALNYTGSGGTAITIKNNNNFEVRGFYMNNAGSGTTTGLALQSVSAGSSSTQAQPVNLILTGFTTGIRIGSTGDLASSEAFLQNISIQTGTTGVLIEGASPSTNSISLHFQNIGVLSYTTAFKFSGDNTAANNILTFRNCEAGSCITDFDFQTPAHVVIDGFHTEGDTAGWKFMTTATATAGKPPLFMEVKNVNMAQAQGVDSVIAWPGSFHFRNADFGGLGIDAGDPAAGNCYQFDIWGRDITIDYAAGAHSVINALHWASNISASNNQSVIKMAWDIYVDGGTKTTIMQSPWSNSPTPLLQIGVTGVGVAPSTTTNLIVAAGTTGVSSLRIPHGSAPTTPVDGDIWTTTGGLFVRVNGVTVGPLT